MLRTEWIVTRTRSTVRVHADWVRRASLLRRYKFRLTVLPPQRLRRNDWNRLSGQQAERHKLCRTTSRRWRSAIRHALLGASAQAIAQIKVPLQERQCSCNRSFLLSMDEGISMRTYFQALCNEFQLARLAYTCQLVLSHLILLVAQPSL